MLELSRLCVYPPEPGRDEPPWVQDVDMRVPQGACLLLLGSQGSGRSTLVQGLAGHLPRQGHYAWQNQDLSQAHATRVARAGVGFVSETRDVFVGLSVTENLQVAQRHVGAGMSWSLAHTWAHFEPLAKRQHAAAQTLSGGEQQLLALARTLMTRPTCLLLDEPFEGLSLKAAQAVLGVLQQALAHGVTVVVTDQKAMHSPALAHQVMQLDRGRCVWQGTVAAWRMRSAMDG